MKWVLRYLKRSTDVGILYGGGAIGKLGATRVYVDFDYVGSFGHKKIPNRICFHIVWWNYKLEG